ncbi:MAG: ABC transporter substrate-binding protein [Hungatella sp.]|jgi:D-methionine transport system substrate-binding protein|nr:ABC transporter substrate-binding protein [Hungatella sp.]
MRKTICVLAAAALLTGSLTGCSGNGKTETTAAQTTAAGGETTAAQAETKEVTNTAPAASGEVKKIIIGASPAPHAEILRAAGDVLAAKGYELDIKEYVDYIQPNLALESGDLDANYFQHLPYLESFNEENGTKLVSAASIHYEPFGIYAGKTKSLEELADGATVAVPNDTSNEARALLLLEAQGLIKLKEGAGLTATKNDIVENPKNIKLYEVEAAQIPRSIDDVDVAVINGNYAIDAGFKVSDALAVEDSQSIAATTYGNVIAVQEGRENEEAIKALIEALESDEVKAFIETTYEGAVVPLY